MTLAQRLSWTRQVSTSFWNPQHRVPHPLDHVAEAGAEEIVAPLQVVDVVEGDEDKEDLAAPSQTGWFSTNTWC